jgi:ribosomal protein L17
MKTEEEEKQYAKEKVVERLITGVKEQTKKNERIKFNRSMDPIIMEMLKQEFGSKK